MAGIDKHTGQMIERPEAIRQSIDTLLTTPIGSRVMRRDVGFAALNDDGKPKLNLTHSEIELAVRKVLSAYEPRISIAEIMSVFDTSGKLDSVRVKYTDVESGVSDQVIVQY